MICQWSDFTVFLFEKQANPKYMPHPFPNSIIFITVLMLFILFTKQQETLPKAHCQYQSSSVY